SYGGTRLQKRWSSEVSWFGNSGAPSPRSMLTSLAIHIAAAILLLLIPAKALGTSTRPKELEVVFHRPRPPVEVPVKVPAPALPEGPGAARGKEQETPAG